MCGVLVNSMYEKYIKERENLDVIKNEFGFICYRIEKDHCFINDYFVLEEHRRKGIGYSLADQVFEICKQKGIKEVYCQTDDTANGALLSAHTILNYGFVAVSKDGNVTCYYKEVE